MATTVNIGGNGDLFVGEDKTIRLLLPGTDMAGWSILFDVRKTNNSVDPAIFSKVATVSGTFNVDQVASIVLTDTEMNTVKASNYRYSFKRMDDAYETVLARGNFTPEKATAP